MPVATCILIITFTLQKLSMNQKLPSPSQLPLNADVEFNVDMFQSISKEECEHSSCQRQTPILDGSIQAVIKFRWLVVVTYHSFCFHQASRIPGWGICFAYASFFGNERRFLWLNRCRRLTDSKSNVRGANTGRQCDRLHTESVAMLTVNIPVKSDICFQSSPLGSLQQFPWKPHCHFPPLFGALDILKAFFLSLGLLKLARPPVDKIIQVCFIWLLCVSVQVGVLTYSTHLCACMCVSFIWPSEQRQTCCPVCAAVWTGWCWAL